MRAGGGRRQAGGGVTPHNEAKSGDYAEAVLLPGDPGRAQWIADTFLTGVRQVNGVRHALGFTGSFRGKPVSLQATGMGQPSLAIYVHELITAYGAKTLIRVGTCGGLSQRVKLRDIVIATTASTDSAMDREAFRPWHFSPVADYGLLRTAADIARQRGLPAHVGGIASTDAFYPAAGLAAYDALIAHGVLAVEMETHAFYTLAARHGVRALTLCAMTDSVVTGEHLARGERQSSLKDLAELALAVATGA
jgi:purine-nucleoside phosphorylase